MRGLCGDENVPYFYCIGQHPRYVIILQFCKMFPLGKIKLRAQKDIFYSFLQLNVQLPPNEDF